MANRQKGYGLTAEINRKINAKYDVDQEQEARLWMEDVVGEPLDPNADPNEPLGMDRFHELLKDGTYICRVASEITGKKIKTNNMKMAFKQMENINNFLQACEKMGMSKVDLFQTVDLYEKQNMHQVVCCLHALGRKAQSCGYDGPSLGPKEATKNHRHFTDDQLKAGEGVIGLQMGTNKVASQKGMSFGRSRHIADIKCEDISKDGQGVIGLQMGTNQVASQKGMSFGTSRGIADIRCDDLSREGTSAISLQMGTNQGASQAGMNMGKARSIVD